MATAAQAHREAESGVPDPLHECEGEIAARRLSSDHHGAVTDLVEDASICRLGSVDRSGIRLLRRQRIPHGDHPCATIDRHRCRDDDVLLGEPTVCPPPKK